MKWHGFQIAILIASILMVQFSFVLASGESNNSEQEKSLTMMAVQNSTANQSSVDEYANRTNAKLVSFFPNPSNPKESSYWQQDDDGNLNASTYLNLIELVRVQYLEDLNYSSYILDDFVKKKIDNREAMTATMTLFVLTSQTVDLMDQIKPPGEFETYQDTTLQALVNLEGYLWNMVKYYETTRRVYAVQAHENFNRSMAEYNQGVNLTKKYNS